MKRYAALVALTLAVCISTPAQAQQKLGGTWRVEKVGQAQPPEGITLTLTFAEEGKLVVTYNLPNDAAQSWDYRYTATQSRITLTPTQAFGEPSTIEYDIRFEAGKLLLLPPKPEEEDADTDTGSEAEGEQDPDRASADETDPTGDDADTAEEKEEEDMREPVWTLVQA